MDVRVSLALRRRRGRPVLAADLAAGLGLRAEDVLAATDGLQAAGFVIESHPIMGLRLVQAPGRLLEAEVAHRLATRRVGRRVRCVDRTASTNDLAWEAAALGPEASDGLAVLAEYQSAGRGRRGNRWVAPPHTSILASVIVWTPQAATQGGLLTRSAALAAAEAVEDACPLRVGIRWPNDLVIDDRKVGGVLVEARPGTAAPGPAVIGIGINCSQGPEAFPAEFRQASASLAMCGEDVDRTLLARALLERLDGAIARTGDPAQVSGLRQEAAARCQTLGRRITVAEGDATFRGEVVDLDPDYELVLRLEDGGLRRFDAVTTHVLPEGAA